MRRRGPYWQEAIYGYAVALVIDGWLPDNLRCYREKMKTVHWYTEGQVLLIESAPKQFISGGWDKLISFLDKNG